MLSALCRNLAVETVCRCVAVAALAGMTMSESAVAADAPAKDPDSRGRSTAVALNYCRASFHRIRQNPSKRVMLEEQEKILNNLNLDGIADEAVIKLYSEVLDEVAQIEIAERETAVLQDKFKKTLHREIGVTALAMAAQMATLSLERVVYTGVNSWLDYRDMSWTREFDAWKVEKSRINAVVNKSSRFLDTFWKLTQSKNIPDRWLVRGNDLDDLTEAIQEPDLNKRLRILKRMEPYMECYPPYWYYVGRTQQGLGDLVAAAETYDRLGDLGHGHFRRDDMLAASLANLAIIEDFLQKPGAERTALAALSHSPDVWQANLLAAQVLERHGRLQEAEDAILRNLDVGLEGTRSTVALVGLYYRQDKFESLASTLADEEMLKSLPVLSVVQAAARLATVRSVPPSAIQRIRSSLRVAVEPRFGDDDLVIACDPIWQSESATIRLQLAGQPGGKESKVQPTRETHPSGETVWRFSGVIDGGNPLRPASPNLAGTVLVFEFSKTKAAPLVVALGEPMANPIRSNQATAPWWTAASPSEVRFRSAGLNLIAASQSSIGDRAAVPERSTSNEPSPLSPTARRPRITIIGIRARELPGRETPAAKVPVPPTSEPAGGRIDPSGELPIIPPPSPDLD